MKVAFVTPEFQSLVRRTHLAEFSEQLPKTLRQLGVDARVFLPHTQDVEVNKLADLKEVARVKVKDVDRTTDFVVRLGYIDELPIYLLDHPEFFRNRHPYGDENGPYPDNWRRYAAFTRAVLETLGAVSFSVDIIHTVDWTTGLFPLIQQREYTAKKPGHAASKAGTYFGIHNLAMQGSFEREILPKIRLPHSLFKAIHGIELRGKVNFLKAGAEFATIVGTHSPTQAERVQERDRGDGLEETFQRRKKELVGVLSGIDYRAWDPATDPLLPHKFSATDKDLGGKRRCKAALQSALKLDNGPRTPLLTIVGRFDNDSGFDILAEALTPMLERNIELVLMGPGQAEVIERLRTVEETFTGRCRLIEGYNVKTAHTLLAGADMLLLPAHYHSSNALCAIGMRYGAVPIVYAHSGLEDTVLDRTSNPETGTGFHFANYSSDSLLGGVDTARVIYKKVGDWKELVRASMHQDFSWQESGRSYVKAYRRVTRRVRSKPA